MPNTDTRAVAAALLLPEALVVAFGRFRVGDRVVDEFGDPAIVTSVGLSSAESWISIQYTDPEHPDRGRFSYAHYTDPAMLTVVPEVEG